MSTPQISLSQLPDLQIIEMITLTQDQQLELLKDLISKSQIWNKEQVKTYVNPDGSVCFTRTRVLS